uniref:KRAB domain-containing protein n=1 Tax=Equus asinus TaxID=9793 RepID=A0A9L0JTZ5_EQUAS
TAAIDFTHGDLLSRDPFSLHEENTEAKRMVAVWLKDYQQDSMTLDNMVVDFTQKEWLLLDLTQRNLYRDKNLVTVGYQLFKPSLITWLEQGKKLRAVDRGVLQGRDPQWSRTL